VGERWTGARVIAIDPGREKCGLAALDGEGRLLQKAVVPTNELTGLLARVLPETPAASVAIGGGTYSHELQDALHEALPDLTVTIIPEAHSTERALERWRSVEAPRGWRCLLPRSLRFPPGPIDDFAAWTLAEEYLRGVSSHG
jgi:RNase H-fold protein (predicted Holliday junction resolvase)